MMLSILPAMAAQSGNIKDMYPPGNDGLSHGVGIIEDANGDKFVFQTPQANNGEVLTEGNIVFFTLSENGKRVESVSLTNPDSPDLCPDGTVPPCPGL